MSIFVKQTNFPEFYCPTGKNLDTRKNSGMSKIVGIAFKNSYVALLAHEVSLL